MCDCAGNSKQSTNLNILVNKNSDGLANNKDKNKDKNKNNTISTEKKSKNSTFISNLFAKFF
jgi:hypothetical protein